MEMRFTPEHKNINELFGRDIKYIIPEYQRPYSWDCIGKSDKNNQVNVMWDDLLTYYRSGDKKNTYFFGSMVLIGNGNAEYQVIDGQQRLTTTVLLFAAIKCFLNNLKPAVTAPNLLQFIEITVNFVDDVLYNKRLFGAATIEKKLKIEKSSGFDYDTVLNEALDCKDKTAINLTQASGEQKAVVGRYFGNIKFFKESLKNEFLQNNLLTDRNAEDLNNFIEFLKNRVSVVRILTPTFDVAYHIFEILNNRGLPLSNKDLFRNMLIKEWDILKNNDPAKFKHVDSAALWNELDSDYEFEDDFISRWVESYKAGKQQYSAFNDIKEIYEKDYKDLFPQKKIELFYADIKRDLGYYTKIVRNTFDNPNIRAKINFILRAPNYRYSLNFLLANVRCFEGKEPGDFIKVLEAYERYILWYLLCARFSAAPVFNAIGMLKKLDWQTAITALDVDTVKATVIHNLHKGPLIENEIAKLLLAKIVWLEEANVTDDTVVQQLIYENATLEHIIPQLTNGTQWENKFSEEFIDEYTYSLGNMTLLTSKINSSLRNSYFDAKKKQYAKTKLPMTLRLAAIEDITEEYIKERHEQFVDIILKDVGIV